MVVKSLQTTDFTQHFHFTTQERKPTAVERLAWVTWLFGGRVSPLFPEPVLFKSSHTGTLSAAFPSSVSASCFFLTSLCGPKKQEYTPPRGKENEADSQEQEKLETSDTHYLGYDEKCKCPGEISQDRSSEGWCR